MKVGEKHYRSIWADGGTVRIIDQTRLPHEFAVIALETLDQAAAAIRDMQVRGAPLIGAAAAYGIAIAMRDDPGDEGLRHAVELLMATRPTAVNLRWALEAMAGRLVTLPPAERAETAMAQAAAIADEDIAINAAIGDHGLAVIEAIAAHKSGPVNLLTHCNAGWLATVDWG
ncbi:MAG: S-methyl-5-thioribose-1-phosphate isomerase, partial [Novosphingobium sp.]|nr:S-methyl-5-thioribose-1-phosphate isomerase [Novosphingobium sp.]